MLLCMVAVAVAREHLFFLFKFMLAVEAILLLLLFVCVYSSIRCCASAPCNITEHLHKYIIIRTVYFVPSHHLNAQYCSRIHRCCVLELTCFDFFSFAEMNEKKANEIKWKKRDAFDFMFSTAAYSTCCVIQ